MALANLSPTPRIVIGSGEKPTRPQTGKRKVASSQKTVSIAAPSQSIVSNRTGSAAGSMRLGDLEDSEHSFQPKQPKGPRRTKYSLYKAHKAYNASTLAGQGGKRELRTRTLISRPLVASTSLKPQRAVYVTPRESLTHVAGNMPVEGLEMNTYLDMTFQSPTHRGDVRRRVSEEIDSSSDTDCAIPEESRNSTDSDVYNSDLKIDVSSKYLFEESGRKRYLHYCERTGLTPCSALLRQSLDNRVNLRYYGLGPRDTCAMAKLFWDNPYVTQLDLSHNSIGALGVKHLARALTFNQHLTHIELSFCFLGREDEGCKAVCTLIEKSANIHHLDLSHNCFKSKDYVFLTKMIQCESRLYTLDLSDNELSSVGCTDFAAAIQKNDILVNLNLSLNPLLSDGASMIIKALSKNVKLRSMTMRQVGMDKQANKPMKRLLNKNCTLTLLDVRDNHLAPPANRGFAKLRTFIDKHELPLQILSS